MKYGKKNAKLALAFFFPYFIFKAELCGRGAANPDSGLLKIRKLALNFPVAVFIFKAELAEEAQPIPIRDQCEYVNFL
jgi:hypothetical protein